MAVDGIDGGRGGKCICVTRQTQDWPDVAEEAIAA